MCQRRIFLVYSFIQSHEHNLAECIWYSISISVNSFINFTQGSFIICVLGMADGGGGRGAAKQSFRLLGGQKKIQFMFRGWAETCVFLSGIGR